jgi:hypothetical protein
VAREGIANEMAEVGEIYIGGVDGGGKIYQETTALWPLALGDEGAHIGICNASSPIASGQNLGVIWSAYFASSPYGAADV